MAHIPGNHIAACRPGVAVAGHVAVNFDAVVRGRQVAVHIGGCHLQHLVLLEPARRLLHHGKGLRQDVVQHILGGLIDLVLQLLHLFVKFLLLLDGQVVVGVKIIANFFQTILLRGSCLADGFAKFDGLMPQIVQGKVFDNFVCFQRLAEQGLQLFHITVGLGAEQFGQEICHIILLFKVGKNTKIVPTAATRLETD